MHTLAYPNIQDRHWPEETCLPKPVLNFSTVFMQHCLYGTLDTSKVDKTTKISALSGYHGKSPEAHQ